MPHDFHSICLSIFVCGSKIPLHQFHHIIPQYLCLSVCSMGYDMERFVGYVNEGLLCCVCRDVLEDPLQAPCEHAFCSTCIHAWLVNHQNCPEDRLPLSIANLRPLYRYLCQLTENMPINIVSAMTRPHNTFLVQ